MPSRQVLAAVVVAAAVLAAVAVAVARDDDDGTSLVTRWRLRIDQLAVTPPVVADGTVYVAGRAGMLVAADLDTGRPRWRFASGEPVGHPVAAGSGLVYLTTAPSAGGGSVFALDGRTGQEHWRLDSGVPLAAPPAVGDGLVYLAAGDVIALDAVTGEERWRRVVRGRAEAVTALAGGVVVSTGRGLTALDATTGEQRWTWVDRRPGDTAPVVAGDLVGVVDGAGTLVGLGARDGRERWRVGLGGGAPQAPVAAGARLAVVTVGGVVVVDEEGATAWSAETGEAEGRRVGASDSVVAVAGDRLSVLDASTGVELGSTDLDGDDPGEPAVTGDLVVVADDGLVEAMAPPAPGSS